ncbi:MAG: sulfatase-like hydrolase/transferase [Acidobacteriaceae bacterium]|nr:sulfatase-like hydrolase/transferase [Acidobacteriaceae bacterium]
MADLTRRDWLGAATSGVAAAAGPQTQGPRTAGNRPNIVLIISDQFRADNLGCMGMNPMNLTPNLDLVARRGALFRSAMANQPVCAPARATMFTGLYPEKHGVWRNGIGLNPNANTLASLLRENGYTANYIGKWHLSPAGQSDGPVPLENRGGFRDLWEAANALEHTSHAYEGEMFDGDGKPIRFSGTYRVDFLTNRAVRFLREKRTQAPFLLCVSYLETHHQNDLDAFQPPKKYADKYRNFFVPQDLRSLPGSWPSQLADYYGCVKAIDDAVGTLVATLKELSLEDNTIIAFISDHSCHFKTRNTEYKRSPHESSIHIPLIVAGPQFNRAVEVPELVGQIDLTPSLLEAAGLPIPSSMQGRSFLPLVSRHIEGWRNEVYIGMREFVTGRLLRTPQWTYAVSAPKMKNWKSAERSDRYVEYMLYDLYADPFEHTNLAGHQEFRTVAEDLRGRLFERIAEAGDPRPEIDPAWFPYV